MPEAAPDPNALLVPLEAIVPGPNVRRDWERVDTSLRQLADSIGAQGILEPLVVREIVGSRGPRGARRFRLVAGFRRYAAARLLNLERVPVRVLSASDSEAMIANLTENLARADLPEGDAIAAVQALRDTYGLGTRQIARATGRSAGWVSELLSVADSREERHAVEAGLIGINAAARIVRLRAAAPELRAQMIERLEHGETIGRDEVPRMNATREARRVIRTPGETAATAELDAGSAGGVIQMPSPAERGAPRLALSPADESMIRNLRLTTRLTTARLYTLHREQGTDHALAPALADEMRRARDELEDYLASRQLIVETQGRLQRTVALLQSARDESPAETRAAWDTLVAKVQRALDGVGDLAGRIPR